MPAFSPHDLRHRRATLWHLSGVPVAEAAAWLGHSAQEHVNTYAHATLVDRRELDFGGEGWGSAFPPAAGHTAAAPLPPRSTRFPAGIR